MIDLPVPGWEAELTFERSNDGGLTVTAVAHRTTLGPMTEEDVWMIKYGKAYLDDLVKRNMKKVSLGDLDERLRDLQEDRRPETDGVSWGTLVQRQSPQADRG